MKDLPLRCRAVVRTSNMKSSRRPLTDYVKNCIKKRATRAARTSVELFDVVWQITGSLSNHDDDENKNPTNLHI